MKNSTSRLSGHEKLERIRLAVSSPNSSIKTPRLTTRYPVICLLQTSFESLLCLHQRTHDCLLPVSRIFLSHFPMQTQEIVQLTAFLYRCFSTHFSLPHYRILSSLWVHAFLTYSISRFVNTFSCFFTHHKNLIFPPGFPGGFDLVSSGPVNAAVLLDLFIEFLDVVPDLFADLGAERIAFAFFAVDGDLPDGCLFLVGDTGHGA